MSRRHLIGGLGAAGVATAAGLTLDGVAHAAADGANDGTPPYASETRATVDTRDLANPISLALSAGEFHGLGNSTYGYVSPGGVQVIAPGPGTWFDADLKLPVGATITGADVYLNPNGGPRTVRLVRYRPVPAPPTFEDLIDATSTNGTAVETVPLAITHTVEAGWNYKLGQVRLDPAGAILYGGRVTYTIPPDPTGYFVPFTGGNPRVYDSRTGAGKLAANQERVIPLGVPGTVKAAVFNLTATETETAGFVACFRADVAWPGNSSINWYETGANVANLVVSAVDATGSIRIRGGNDETHVIIDLVGWFA